MSTEPGTIVENLTDAASAAALENELPTYRAITPLAVLSFLLGLASVLSFAWGGFLLAAALAVASGAVALRKISRFPKEVTGRGFANAGIVMGLAFGLSSVTYAFTQEYLIRQRATKFVQGELIPLLKRRDLNSMLWYKVPPLQRRSMTPEQVRETIDNPKISNPMYLEMQAGPIVRLLRTLQEHEEIDPRFVKIERVTTEDVKPVVIAVLEIVIPKGKHDHEDGGEAHDHDHAHDEAPGSNFAAIVLKSSREGKTESWWVEDYYYPYTPESYSPKIKPVDDGHGHAH